MGDLNYRLDPTSPAVQAADPATRPAAASAAATGAASSASSSAAGIELSNVGGCRGVNVKSSVVSGRESAVRKSKDVTALHAAESTDFAIVHRLIVEEDWGSLLAMDQLHGARTRGEAFVGMHEGRVEWAPTFKVRRSSGTEYTEQRVPSYCDRVLWKSMPAVAACLQQTAYTSVPQVSTSDHKPVVAAFNISCPPRPTPLLGGHGSADGGGFRLHFRHLQLTKVLAADVGGTSDPYCVFFTSPPGLLQGTPRTPIKRSIPGVSADGAPAAHRATRRLPSGSAGSMVVQFDEKELPLLKLNVSSLDELAQVRCIHGCEPAAPWPAPDLAAPWPDPDLAD